MFPQLFGKLFATPPQQKYFMTWYVTEFFYFKFSIAVPYFLNKLHNTLNKFRNIYIQNSVCIPIFVTGLKMSVLISETLYKHLNRKKPIQQNRKLKIKLNCHLFETCDH